MFGNRYFGARYYGDRYWGGGSDVTPPTPTPEEAPYYYGGGRHDTSWWDDLLEDLANVRKAVRKKGPTDKESAKALAAAIEAQQLPVDVDLDELRNATERLRLLVARMSGELETQERNRRIEAARKAVLAETKRLAMLAAERKRQEEDDAAIELLLLAAV